MTVSVMLAARRVEFLRRVILPTGLLTAAEVGKEFLAKAGFPFARLEEGKYDMTKDQWRLIFLVGVVSGIKKTLIVDDKTGQVVAVE